MIKSSLRKCPVCDESSVEVLHTQRFVLQEGHPLSNGYDVVSCNKCGFVFADTNVLQEEYDRFYMEYSKYEDSQTVTGAGETPWDAKRFEDIAQAIVQFLPDKNQRILDVGCANGGLLKQLRESGYSNLHGIDPSQNCVVNTQALGVFAVKGSLFQIPENIGKFDCIILSHVLEHVKNLKDALSSIKHLLRDDGECGSVYVEVPDANRYKNFYITPYHFFDIEHINHFSLISLNNLLSSVGLNVFSNGFRDFEINDQVFYPALWAICTKSKVENFKYTHDSELRHNINKYIELSKENFKIGNIDRFALNNEPIIVWGIGCSTTRLLANSALGRANITAFVDNNKKYWGTKLNSIPVIPPADLIDSDYKIIITSKIYGKQIVSQIIEELGISIGRIVRAYSE